MFLTIIFVTFFDFGEKFLAIQKQHIVDNVWPCNFGDNAIRILSKIVLNNNL